MWLRLSFSALQLLDELNKAMLANGIDYSQTQEAAGFTKFQVIVC